MKKYREQHDHKNIMNERQLKLYDDILNFPAHVLMGILYINCQEN